VGYKTVTLPVKGNRRIDVTLVAEVASLDDVVVVGFGSQKKVTVVGSISTIGTKELRQSPTTN
jgi:hypothetical protein